jgi:CheY-like chemotaxis protein
VVGGALVDLAPLHDGREAGRAIFVAAITGSGVDRPALEALRAEKLADMTVASEQILTSLADIADVLTPEQRVELAEMAERWHH